MIFIRKIFPLKEKYYLCKNNFKMSKPKTEQPKHVLVTWHYTTHGIAYLKHILSAFHREHTQGAAPDLSRCKGLAFDQQTLQSYFDRPNEDGFKFDEIIYLTAPQQSFDNISSRRKDRNNREINDEEGFGLSGCYDALAKQEFFRKDIQKEMNYVNKEFPDLKDIFVNFLWRTMQYYPVNEQIKWLLEMSNFKKAYNTDVFKTTELKVDNLRDEEQIVKAITGLIKNWDTKNTLYYINISLGSNETQVAWHVVSQAGLLPGKIHFFKTYDKKEDSAPRFKPFTITEVNSKLIQDIADRIKLYPETKSLKRQAVNELMKLYLETGFSILLLGERGIGKTHLANQETALQKDGKNSTQGQFISANCASFAEDTMAESELFGYVKGAFTDAYKDTDGLIKSAENGILFLDEIHSLSTRVQAKLMTALQTDENNNLTIRKLGSTETEKIKNVKLVFASNRTIDELREALLPDFYDRIVQHVIELPPLRESPEDSEQNWTEVWKQLQFDGKHPCPTDKEFLRWLKTQSLPGNYRDLQKIAIHYKTYLDIKKSNNKVLIDNLPDTPLDYVKEQFGKYNQASSNERFTCDISISDEKTMRAEFNYKLQEWAVNKYGSREEAHKKLKVDVKTLNNWKNNWENKK